MRNFNSLKSTIYSVLCIVITILVDAGLISIGMWPIAIMSTAFGVIYPIVEILDKVVIIKSQDKQKIEKEFDDIDKNSYDENQSLCNTNFVVKYDKELRYEEDRKRINISFQENQNEPLSYREEQGPMLIKRKK